MRILHVAWEYPPLVYGGLGRHVGALAEAQARAGHDVTVVTQAPAEPTEETRAGVRIVRVPRDPPELPFSEATLLGWVAGLEHSLTRAVATRREPVADVVHAHDWMVAHTALSARAIHDAPLVTTMHATEAGRHQGWLHGELTRAIHGTEYWLARQSSRVIACSEHMRREVRTLFELPADHVDVIPNGIDLSEWSTNSGDRALARARYAGDRPLIVFAGRLEWEKGVHTLLTAMLLLRRQFPDVKLVVAGRGGKERDLHAQAERLKLSGTVDFAGWLPEEHLHAVIAAADVSVVPSLYEPFGLVALEAAALGTPVIVAQSGGLSEFAAGDRALTFPAGDPDALADTMATALNDPDAMARRLALAEASLRDTYNWDLIAASTTATYEAARTAAPVAGDELPPVVPEGNVFAALA